MCKILPGKTIINPVISYAEAIAFKNKFKYPLTTTSISFVATSAAEIKYETDTTDPENNIVGVDEYFMDNSGLKTSLGRNFNAFDIQNNSYTCIIGSDFQKVLKK